MPRGTIVWFDAGPGDAQIEHLGRRFPARVDDIEPHARTAGAVVHFDITRDDGVERAVRVVLVPGVRTSVHQHRRGDLAGHVRADATGHAAMSGRQLAAEPHRERLPAHEIAETWLRHARYGELDDAAALYAPAAQVHVGSVTRRGLDAARRAIAACALFGRWDLATGVEDEGDAAVVGWAAGEGATAGMTRMRIVHGQIFEQWLPGEP